MLIPQKTCNSYKHKSEKTELKTYNILMYPSMVLEQGILSFKKC